MPIKIWTEQEVNNIAEKMGYTLNPNEAYTILKNCSKRGKIITSDNITNAIGYYVEELV